MMNVADSFLNVLRGIPYIGQAVEAQLQQQLGKHSSKLQDQMSALDVVAAKISNVKQGQIDAIQRYLDQYSSYFSKSPNLDKAIREQREKLQSRQTVLRNEMDELDLKTAKIKNDAQSRLDNSSYSKQFFTKPEEDQQLKQEVQNYEQQLAKIETRV